MTKEELEKESKENFEQYKLTDEDYVEYDGEKILMFNYEYYAEDEYFRFYSNGYLAGAEPREKRIAELEKENAELKERIQTLEQIKKEHTDYTIKVEEERTSVKEQLTKAKEIIKLLLWDLRNRSYEPVKDVERAEQFLSEVEK